MKSKTKILLADDHLYVSEALRLYIDEHAAARLEVVATARDGAAAVAAAKKHKPDLVVMDVEMPKMTGIEALREIKKLSPAPTVLILSAHDDRARVVEALSAGADDYLCKKDMTPARLTAHIQRAAAKALPLRGGEAGEVLKQLRAAGGTPELTPTEMEVLKLAAYRGFSAKDVSRELSGGKMSIRTVATHWQHIYDKLGAHSQAQAVCVAVQRGIISAEPAGNGSHP